MAVIDIGFITLHHADQIGNQVSPAIRATMNTTFIMRIRATIFTVCILCHLFRSGEIRSQGETVGERRLAIGLVAGVIGEQIQLGIVVATPSSRAFSTQATTSYLSHQVPRRKFSQL